MLLSPSRYREGGAEVIEVLSKFSNCVERASVDEAYIDLSAEVERRLAALQGEAIRISQLPNTFVVGYDGKSDKQGLYSKICVKQPLSKRQKLVFNTNYRLMQVKSIAECSKGSICH